MCVEGGGGHKHKPRFPSCASVGCFPTGLADKIVAKGIRSHMHTHGLQEPLQSAYWEGCSTETVLVCARPCALQSGDGHGCHTPTFGSVCGIRYC